MTRLSSWLFAPVALVAMATAACTLPPYTFNGAPFTVKYSMFIPSAANGIPLATGIPAFSDKQAPPSTIDVPKEAKTFKIAALELGLNMTNTGPLPLRMKIYLGRTSDNIYTTQPLGGAAGEIDLPRGGSVSKSLPIDPALMQEDKLQLGYTFGSPGTTESVTFKAEDAVTVAYSIKATVKLF